MKIAFIYDFIIKLLKKNIASHINFIISVASITIIITLAIVLWEFTNSKLQEISDEFTVAIVLKDNITNTRINSIITELMQYEVVKKAKHQESTASLKKFLNNHGFSEEELLLDGSFPEVILLTLQLNYFDQTQFFYLIDNLRTKPYIDEVLYKEAYINNIFKIVDEFSVIFLGIIFFLILLATTVIIQSIKNVYSILRKNFELLMTFGSSKFYNFLISIQYILILIIIGFLVSILIISVIWQLLALNNININIDFTFPTIYAILVILCYVIIIKLVSMLFLYRH